MPVDILMAGVDPLTAGLVVGALFSAYSATKSPKTPNAKPPPEQKPNVEAVRNRRKQQAIGAYGSMDTMLTGPQGLGSVSPVNKQYASLLGGGGGK